MPRNYDNPYDIILNRLEDNLLQGRDPQTQTALAEAVGMTRAQLNRGLRQKRGLQSRMREIADALNMSYEQLVPSTWKAQDKQRLSKARARHVPADDGAQDEPLDGLPTVVVVRIGEQELRLPYRGGEVSIQLC